MAKMTIDGVTYEGTAKELADLVREFTALGAEAGFKTVEDDALKVGDYVVTTKAIYEYAVGDVLLLDGIDPGYFDFSIRNITQDRGGFAAKTFIRKATDEEVAAALKPVEPKTITHKGKEYKQVERKANECDVVVFTDSDVPYITVGKTYNTVARGAQSNLGFYDDMGDDILLYHSNRRTESNVLVYEPIAPPKPKAGDIVVITANTNSSRNKVGDIGVIVADEYDSEHTVRVSVKGRSRYGNFTRHDEMRLATPAEREQYEAAVKAVEDAKKPKLKSGDYAKALADGQFRDIKAGSIVKFETDECGDGDDPYSIYAKTNDESDYFRPQDLRKATDEEVASAKRDAIFTKIGRKPGEFKKGDIVRDKDTGVDIVKEVEPEGYADYMRGLTMERAGWTYKHHCELIAPVESRVDAK
ncbi:hypothetical protein [Sporosarcina phage Lietuvens]|nr:hypothetical protein [Sporosarcina phage Lietuvens]